MTDTPGPAGQILLYGSEDGRTKLDVRLDNDTVWLSQRKLTELFGKAKGTISEHIKHIFEDGELASEATVRSFRTVQLEGDREVARDLEHYNLDMVIALGFRVLSAAAVRFRQWAADRLKEYTVKGVVLDDDRLNAADYFDELLTCIREIRASEARVYQRIREIFAFASDYDETDQATLRFFAFMQNKTHYAATGLTAAEIVRRRADADHPNMVLTSWSGGRVLKRDVGTAKNYLDPQEIDTLNRIVVMFLDRAEFRAQRRRDIKVADWEADLDKFLADTELPVRAACRTMKRWNGLARSTTRLQSAAAPTQRPVPPRAISRISRLLPSCSTATGQGPHRRSVAERRIHELEALARAACPAAIADPARRRDAQRHGAVARDRRHCILPLVPLAPAALSRGARGAGVDRTRVPESRAG